jgi:hypothetical protein
MQRVNSVRLTELSDERSSQDSSTRYLQQSCQPSMAMGEASSAPYKFKGIPDMHFFLFSTWHAHHTELFDPHELPGFISCTLCVLLALNNHQHPPTIPSHPYPSPYSSHHAPRAWEAQVGHQKNKHSHSSHQTHCLLTRSNSSFWLVPQHHQEHSNNLAHSENGDPILLGSLSITAFVLSCSHYEGRGASSTFTP